MLGTNFEWEYFLDYAFVDGGLLVLGVFDFDLVDTFLFETFSYMFVALRGLIEFFLRIFFVFVTEKIFLDFQYVVSLIMHGHEPFTNNEFIEEYFWVIWLELRQTLCDLLLNVLLENQLKSDYFFMFHHRRKFLAEMIDESKMVVLVQDHYDFGAFVVLLIKSEFLEQFRQGIGWSRELICSEIDYIAEKAFEEGDHRVLKIFEQIDVVELMQIEEINDILDHV